MRKSSGKHQHSACCGKILEPLPRTALPPLWEKKSPASFGGVALLILYKEEFPPG